LMRKGSIKVFGMLSSPGMILQSAKNSAGRDGVVSVFCNAHKKFLTLMEPAPVCLHLRYEQQGVTSFRWIFFLKEIVMAYVDGFVVPLPKKNLDAYRQIANKAGAIWREHGALEFRECIADDVKPGKLTSFPQSVNLEEGETVVFSWIIYESRAKRDEVNDKVMKDPRMGDMMNPEAMPFDGKRMIYGGFEMIVDL